MAYDTPGKFRVRDVIEHLVRVDGGAEYGTLWGGGADAAQISAAGLHVTAYENGANIRDTSHDMARERMASHALENGYTARWGNPAECTDEWDYFFLDWCGPAGDALIADGQAVAARTRRFLMVTLAPSRQKNPEMMGQSGLFTVPFWAMGTAPDFALVMAARYKSGVGHNMWFCVLARPGVIPHKRPYAASHHKFSSVPHPAVVAQNIERDGYWLYRGMERFAQRTALRVLPPRQCQNVECNRMLSMDSHPNKRYCSRPCMKRAFYLRTEDGSAPLGTTYSGPPRHCAARDCDATLDASMRVSARYCCSACNYREWKYQNNERRRSRGGVVAP